MNNVRIWSEKITLPTYGTGEPDKNPLFLDKRVYQGSSGRVYPYPVIEKVLEEKEDRVWTGLFLENEYLKIMIMPEIGGRVQMAYDKTHDYHYVYYNRVIKPALVGLLGPWISGGIEFNWPQHHRPTTYMPVDWTLEERPDGSAVIWCGEIERMYRTKGMIGFTLYPDRAYLELTVKLRNPTHARQTFLWWANPAVLVHDEYQSVFPPDVHAVMDHGKRAVSSFPIATGEYYKVDYSPGTDISRFSTIPVPTSYMAYHSDFDFVGCYDHNRQGGMLHIADHHIVPGKKQWTWGTGDFGQAWYEQLTDEDGPYIELMCGAFTDNQPDFSWLMPGEERVFRQIFMPYSKTGPPTDANRDVVLKFEIVKQTAAFALQVTTPREVTVELFHDPEDRGRMYNHKNMDVPLHRPKLSDTARVLYESTQSLQPGDICSSEIPLDKAYAARTLTLRVSSNGLILMESTPYPDESPEIPKPAEPAPEPKDVPSTEELFLHGLHIEQYHHATISPDPYYEEALNRDPGDLRCNNALGRRLLQRGEFTKAELHFRKSIERLTMRNPNPYDSEPYYNLGVSLMFQERWEDAADAFSKAAWNESWQTASWYMLARIESLQRLYVNALETIDKVLAVNGSHRQAGHLKSALLRHADRGTEALDIVKQTLSADPLDPGALWEYDLIVKGNGFRAAIHQDDSTYIELALEYAWAGLWDDAISVLDAAPGTDVMVQYYRGWIHLRSGDKDKAGTSFRKAAASSVAYCFPNRLECILALSAARDCNPDDAHAPYLLGLFYYAHSRSDDARTLWELSKNSDDAFPTLHRNLGLLYFNKLNDPERALSSYRRAFELDPTDARVLFELDQLKKRTGETPEQRYEFLEMYPALVHDRDDLTIERITLMNLFGWHEKALDALMSRTFHPWEGGEGKPAGQYVTALVELARIDIERGKYEKALKHLDAALVFPRNLGEGKLPGALDNNIQYYRGVTLNALGRNQDARDAWNEAARGMAEPSSQQYYNDQPPDMIFYQGLAYRALGREDEAEKVFRNLIDYADKHINDDITTDYFAVSLPDFLIFEDDLDRRNRIHCTYMAGLGTLGLQDRNEARRRFDSVISLDPSHLGAKLHGRLVTTMEE